MTTFGLYPPPSCLFFIHIPIRDIGVHAFAAGFAVRAERRDFVIALDLPILPLLNRGRAQILVWIAPWILRQTGEIAAELPFFRNDADRRLLDQGFQPLLRRRIDTVVKLVEL